MDALKFLKTVRQICALHENCAGCPLKRKEVTCIITDRVADLAATVAAVEQWAKDRQNEYDTEETSDLHRAIALLSDKVSKLERTVEAMRNVIGHHGAMLNGYESAHRELADRMQETNSKLNHTTDKFRAEFEIAIERDRQLAGRIAALEKEPVESMNDPKPERTRVDVLIEAFPDFVVTVDGFPDICPAKIDANQQCRAWKTTCSECRRAYWLAEVEE